VIFCAAVFAAILWWCWQTAAQQENNRRQPNTNPGAPPFRSLTAIGWDIRAGRREPHSSPGPLPSSSDASFLPPAFALATALMFLFSPHYAWYIIWLVPFFTLMPNLPILAYLLGFFYLYTTALAVPGPRMFLANEILYAAVFAAFLIQLAMKRWSVHRTLFLQHSTASELL
jgi:alpha-1,6-mannosyltransferase